MNLSSFYLFKYQKKKCLFYLKDVDYPNEKWR